MPQERREPLNLTSLGPFTLIDRLGAGGMGVVYRAIDRRSGTVVAVKLLNESISSDPSVIERFRREAHVASLLRSPYTVRLLEFGEDRGRHYIASEFVEGDNLSERLAAGPLDPGVAISIATEIALALDEAAANGITHRDIKPDNVMITGEGFTKVGDFGIASLSYVPGLTAAGAYVGTLAYSAPEQYAGHADTRSDIYALGGVLYQMLAGRRPFESDSAAALMRMHEESPVPLEPLAAIPRPLVDVVLRCLAKDPADRFQRPSELLSALEAARPEPGQAGAAAQHSGDTTHVRPRSSTGEPPRVSPAPRAGTAPEGERLPTPTVAAVAAATERRGLLAGRTRILAIAAVVLVALGGGAAAVLALGGGGSDSSGPPAAATRPVGSGTAGSTLAALAVASATDAPTVTATATDPPTATAAAATPVPPTPAPATPIPNPPTAIPAAPTPVPVAPTPVPPTPVPPTPVPPTPVPTTPVPTTPVPTPIPSTPTPAPALRSTFTLEGFSTISRTDGSLPPTGVGSGGSFSQCAPPTIYAYVSHANVPVGTSLIGNWYYNSVFKDANNAFATNAVNGLTYYPFGNGSGLPAGTYGFVLTANGATVAQGTVRVDC